MPLTGHARNALRISLGHSAANEVLSLLDFLKDEIEKHEKRAVSTEPAPELPPAPDPATEPAPPAEPVAATEPPPAAPTTTEPPAEEAEQFDAPTEPPAGA